MVFRRTIAHTAAVIVGEGSSEQEFLAHVKACFMPRGCGTTLKVRQAYGKGGTHVLNEAIAISRQMEFDRYLAMLDTDTNWNDAERHRARVAGIVVVESNPCIEAVLLRMTGVVGERSTAEWRRELTRRLGRPAHDPRLYEDHFPKDLILAARQAQPSITLLLRTLNVSLPD